MLHTIDKLTMWDQLQEPRCVTGSTTCLLRLLAALDSGWYLQRLVMVVPSQRIDEADVFCFTLVRIDGGESRMMCLPKSRELVQFIHQEHLVLTANQVSFAGEN